MSNLILNDNIIGGSSNDSSDILYTPNDNRVETNVQAELDRINGEIDDIDDEIGDMNTSIDKVIRDFDTFTNSSPTALGGNLTTDVVGQAVTLYDQVVDSARSCLVTVQCRCTYNYINVFVNNILIGTAQSAVGQTVISTVTVIVPKGKKLKVTMYKTSNDGGSADRVDSMFKF